jgi:hypothetical protein
VPQILLLPVALECVHWPEFVDPESALVSESEVADFVNGQLQLRSFVALFPISVSLRWPYERHFREKAYEYACVPTLFLDHCLYLTVWCSQAFGKVFSFPEVIGAV